MQRVTAVPGLLLVTLLYIGWPPSLDVSTTVPARNSLFEFVVELENAEKTPREATAPTAPTTSMVSSALRVRDVWVIGPSMRVSPVWGVGADRDPLSDVRPTFLRLISARFHTLAR